MDCKSNTIESNIQDWVLNTTTRINEIEKKFSIIDTINLDINHVKNAVAELVLRSVPNSASNFPSYHWPEVYKKSDFINKSYNVIVYEIQDNHDGRYFLAHTSDAVGMNGEGETIEDALTSLKEVMECVVDDGVNGGVYPDASSLEYNIEDHKKLEKCYKQDGINVVNKTYHVITLFDGSFISQDGK